MIVNKYKGNGGSGSGYTLPIASETTLGGIKVGDGLSIDSEGVLSSEGGIDSGAVETQILSHNYVTSAEVETQITDKNYITSAQGATLYASQDDMDFISGRTQTNERVLAEAVADIAETDAKFSAYTPTTGFSTINGSAITEGGNIEIQGGGESDNFKIFYVSAWVGNYRGLFTEIANAIDSGITPTLVSEPFSISGDLIFATLSKLERWGTQYAAAHFVGYHQDVSSNPTISIYQVSVGYGGVISNIHSATGTFRNPFINNSMMTASTSKLGGVIVGDYLQVESNGRVSVSPDDMRGDEVYFDSDRVEMTDRTNGDWASFEDNMCGMGVIPLGYAKGEVVLSKIGEDYNIGDCLWRIFGGIGDRFNEAGIYINDDGESNPIMQVICGEDTIDLDMETEGTSAYTINAGMDNPDDYVWHIDQTNEYRDIDGSSELVAVITMKIYDANNDRYLGIAPEGMFSEDDVYVGVDSIQPEVAETVFAQAKKWFDEEAGEDKGKWVKYYNEDNIKEVIANKVSSDTVAKIWRGTQAEYDLIQTPDPTTLYVII